MKVAFASKDNVEVNEHFGWCKEFFIYEVLDDGYKFLSSIDSSLQKDKETEKLIYKIECIEDCDILYVQQIGPKASQMVKSSNIFPLQASKDDEKIEDILKQFVKMRKNPPLWLKRVMQKKLSH